MPDLHVLMTRVSERLTNRRDVLTGQRPNFRCTCCGASAGKVGVTAWQCGALGLQLLCYNCAIILLAVSLGFEHPDQIGALLEKEGR